MSQKKREVLPRINEAIAKLTELAADAAKLEYYDNEQASLRFKRGLVEFENKEFAALKQTSKGIREEIRGLNK